MTSVSMPIQPIVLAQLEQVVAAALCAPEPLATAAFEALITLSQCSGPPSEHGPVFMTYGERAPTDREWAVAKGLLRLHGASLFRQSDLQAPIFVVEDADATRVVIQHTAPDRNLVMRTAQHPSGPICVERLIDLMTLTELARAIEAAGSPEFSVGIHPTKGVEVRAPSPRESPTTVMLLNSNQLTVRTRSSRSSILRAPAEDQWTFMARLDEGVMVLSAPRDARRPSQSPIQPSCTTLALGFSGGALQRLQAGEPRMPAVWVTTLADTLSVGMSHRHQPTLELELQRRLVAWSGIWLHGVPQAVERNPGELRRIGSERIAQLMPPLKAGSGRPGTNASSDR